MELGKADKDKKEEALHCLEDYEKILFEGLFFAEDLQKYVTVPVDSTFEEAKENFLTTTKKKIIDTEIEDLPRGVENQIPYFIFYKEINQFRNAISDKNNVEIETGLRDFFERLKKFGFRAKSIPLNSPNLPYQLLGSQGADRKKQNHYNERLEMFFDLLLEDAKLNGKWKNAKQAVEHVFPIVIEKFEVHTRFKMLEALRDCIDRIDQLKYVIEEAIEYEEGKVDLSLYGGRMHLSKAFKLLKEDQLFLLQLQRALTTNNITAELKKKLKIAYEADYSEEVLLRNLRKNKALLEKIIDKKNGRRAECW